MKVLILTHGTRGDVQPYIALAHALQRAGHTATIALPRCYTGLADAHGIAHVPLDDQWNGLTDDPEIRHALESNYAGIKGKRLAATVLRRTRAYMARVLTELADAADKHGADLVVHHTLVPGQHIGEYLRVPTVPVALQPAWVPTDAFPSPLAPPSVPRFLNRASYASSRMLVRAMYAHTGTWRRDRLGLPRRRGSSNPLTGPGGVAPLILQAFSPRVLPAEPHYPRNVRTTGFWLLPEPEEWSPPQALVDFLAAGPEPVYVGFGSMAGQDPRATARTVAAALDAAGTRTVLVTGEGGLAADAFGDTVFATDNVPHSWLFPKVRAIVHHGGAGTTGAALASGRPQVVCPFTGDQPYWARRAHALGVAPAPVPQSAFDAGTLAAAITAAVDSAQLHTNARALATRINAEQGAVEAVALIETLACTAPA